MPLIRHVSIKAEDKAKQKFIDMEKSVKADALPSLRRLRDWRRRSTARRMWYG